MNLNLDFRTRQAIQFETIIEYGMIRIPEQYAETIPAAVKVTLSPVGTPPIKIGVKSKAGALTLEDFSAFKIDTRNFKFDREEANERR